jgi:two-component system response regulator AtoC
MKKEKILIVDDEDNIRTLLSDMLSLKGFTVADADNPEKALELVESFKPSLVLLDLKLGKADGIDVLKKIKEIDKTTVVIIITAYGSPDTDLKEIRFGAYGEISKPFDINVLEKVVTDALESATKRAED